MSTSPQKPFLDQVMSRKRLLFDSSVTAPKWALVNLVSALFIHTEIEFKFVSFHYLRLTDHKNNTPRLDAILYALFTLFIVNFLLHLWSYFFPTLGKEDVVMNEKQMRLLNVTRSDPGFKMSPEKTSPIQSFPNPFSSPKKGSFILSSPVSTSLNNHSNSSPSSMNWGYSPMMSPMSSGNTSLNSSSWIFQHESPRSSRFHTSVDSISDERSLNSYLKEYENWEKINQSASSEHFQSPGNTTMPSFWKPNLTHQGGNVSHIQDHSAILSKMSYQLSTPMPGGSTNQDNSNLDSPILGQSSKGFQKERLCYRVGIDPLDLVNWMENLRMWISQTILVRLVEEIKETNTFLSHLGLSSVQIGESGLEKVKKCAQDHFTTTASYISPSSESSVSTLLKLIPFLEITVHQDYLVNRITELSRGGAMGKFKWNGGGSFMKQEWAAEKWPSDSELIMHLVACYFDCRLPPVKGVVDGKVFSTLYYFRLQDKPDLSQHKVPCSIVQIASKPPHFVCLVDDKKLELSAGRNNLFHTLLFFLHQIKTKNDGILGRVNLGKSGINILWVID